MPSRSLLMFALIAAVLPAALSTPAFAGEIYGRITLKGASVGDRATIAARCGQKSYPESPTDKSGSYHLIVGESGKCVLIVGYEKQSASLDIVSYEDAAQYDIDLEMKEGKLTARRR